VRLTDDAKSNGQVLLKKGSTIKGVVRKVERADKGNARANGSAQSMMELEWIAPGVSGAAAQSLNLALQSVVYTNPLYAQQEESSANSTFAAPPAAAPRSSSGGLGVGAVGGVATALWLVRLHRLVLSVESEARGSVRRNSHSKPGESVQSSDDLAGDAGNISQSTK
jgi:hypothetical protein